MSSNKSNAKVATKSGDKSIIERCAWAKSPLMAEYHDTEWGVPIHDDRMLFEFLILEGAQAGLSWETVLKKRDVYRKVFDNFEAETIVRYKDKKVEKLLTEPGIIRNRLKILATIENARAYLNVQDEFGSFREYIWRFVEGRPLVNNWKSTADVPARTPISDAMSRELKIRKFKFVGSTICYAFMQATGMVNDHLVSCFRHAQVRKR